jgi:formamidopyrimidine-DNA glycosylase
MPELPEVKAHAERLEASFGGEPLAAFRALSFTALKTFSPGPEAAVGQPLTAVRNRGKLLVLRFGREPAAASGVTDADVMDAEVTGVVVSFVVHLMQGGRLRPDEKQAPKVRGGLARWRFADGRALLLTEAGTDHKAGVWVRDGDPLTQEPLAHLGPDADTVTLEQLTQIVRSGSSRRLHSFLRDQDGIAGLGRRLANEVCWHARLSPFATTKKLQDDELVRLHGAIGLAIAESLVPERARDDMSASKDRPGAVHHRVGAPCTRCGDAIHSVEYRDYTVAYCATCQTGGKVLADNTTSKFLK